MPLVVLPAVFRDLRELDRLPALQHRRDHHEDDEKDEHDVHQGRDVDVVLDAALAAGCERHGTTLAVRPHRRAEPELATEMDAAARGPCLA